MTKNTKRTGKTNAAGRKLMAALEELHHSIVTGDMSKRTVREVEIPGPAYYGAKEVRRLRESLRVSQGVFAAMLGVSPALVQHWEHGVREPGTLARRLLDQIKCNPAAFSESLVRRKTVA